MTIARLAGVSGGSAFQRAVFWMVRRAVGQVPQPLRIAALNKKIFGGYVRMEQALAGARVAVGRRSDLRDEQLLALGVCTAHRLRNFPQGGVWVLHARHSA